VSISGSALNKATRIIAYDTGPGATTAHGFRSTASVLLNEEGAFDGDVVEAQLAHDTEKETLVARQGSAAPAWQRPTRTESAASITVLPIGPDACVYSASLLDCLRQSDTSSNEMKLTGPIHAASGIDHYEISRLDPANRAHAGSSTAVGHPLAKLDSRGCTPGPHFFWAFAG
jgi:hypothetical protein